MTLSGIVNNAFDVYPDVTLASTNTSQAGSRFVYSSEVQQQGQLGRNYSLSLNYRFRKNLFSAFKKSHPLGGFFCMVVIYNLQHTAIDKRWWKIAY